MCEICHYTPCLSGCPNEPEPPVECTCDKCGEPVWEGEEYYEYGGGEILCRDCTEDMTVCELLSFLGCVRKTAEVPA